MLTKLLAGALLAASVALAAPAAASTVITFTGSSATDGTDGNVRTFSNGGITVQATAWSYQGSTLERAWLGAYSNGLGVTNNDEGSGGNNSHAVDNYGQRDFILLVFNQAVNISAVRLNPYAQTSTPRDNDVAYGVTNVAGLFTTPTTSIALNNPLFATLNGSLTNVRGNLTSPFLTNLNSGGRFGNVWLIGAAASGLDTNPDGFKLGAVTVAAVPEPGTWAMMLLGFGAIGYTMRRKRPALLPQAA